MKRKIDDLGRISLPAEMKKEIGLNNGSEANIEIEDHKIIITKPDSINYKAIVDKAIEYIESNPLVISCEYDCFVKDLIQMEELFPKMSFIRTLIEILKGGNDE